MTSERLSECDDGVPFFTLEGQTMSAKIVDVYDADSLRAVVEREGELQKFSIRLTGIDTPEKRSRNPLERRAAKAAHARLLGLLGVGGKRRKEVRKSCAESRRLVELSCGSFDKYGRLLVKLYISDALAGGGTGVRRLCANEELVRMGVAKHYDGGTKEAWRDDELRTIAGE